MLHVSSWLRRIATAAAVLALMFSLNLGVQAEEITTSIPDKSVAELFEKGVPSSLEDLRLIQDHVKDLTQKLIPTVVGVRVGGAQGSGVIISEDGYVLTAGHVVGKPGKSVTFILHDGSTVKGKTLGMNSGIDSGLMKIEEDRKWDYVKMADADSISTGEWCIALGHPGGYEKGRAPVLRLGRIISARDSVLMTDCTLVGGDSGGPLFDLEGNVIGIHSRIGGSIKANMHVPVGTYHDTWDRLAAAESWGGKLGETPNTGPYIGVQGDPEADKAIIVKVYPDTPAAKAGLKDNDVVLSFNNMEVPVFGRLVELVSRQKPGDKVKLRVLRGEEEITLELEIGERE